jgi:hypothetical protein
VTQLNRLNSAHAGGATHQGARGWAALGAVLLCLGLAACGGGGGGGGADTTPALGVLKVTVNDTFGAAVSGATVQGPRGSATTDSQGVALLLVDPSDTTAGVSISQTSFVDKSISLPLVTGQVSEAAVTLVRATSPAGGSLTSRSGVLPTAHDAGQQLTFEIELVVVDGDSRPIENLNIEHFVLRSCAPDAATDRADCVRGISADADVAYSPATTTPEASTQVTGGTARPYAAALLLDQSASIQQTDPTGARLFSAKAFLSGLGTDDRALLAAFASGTGAIIPTPPLAVYGTFQDRASAPSYFATLDGLGALVGGSTPLYEALDALQQRVVDDASLPVDLAKAVVIFTDGMDSCGSPQACLASREQSIQRANDNQVRLFTIGLSSGVDTIALGELANRTGGAFLYADTPEQLLPLYGSVGKLLSLSLPTYRLRWTVQAPSAGVFQTGRTLLGRVQVTAAGSTFDVPFVVGIP